MKQPRLHYIEQGQGDPVILIHGFGCSSAQWMYTLPALADAGYRAIAIDLPGFGRSYLPAEPTTTADYSQQLLSFMDEMEIKQAILIGNSMGGFVSWYAATLAPERVKALVLSNPAGAIKFEETRPGTKPRRGLSPHFATAPWFRAIAGSPLSNPLTRRLVAPIIARAFAPGAKIAPEVREVLHQAAKQARIVFANRLRWRALDQEPRELLQGINIPSLVIWGDEDRVLPVSGMQIFIDNLPQVESIVYQGIGHVPMLEVSEQFNRDVLRFLKKV